MQEIGLFSIPLFKFKNPDYENLKKEVIEYLNDASSYTNTRPGCPALQFTSPNLHKLPLFKNFRQFAEQCLTQTMAAMGFIPNIQLTSVWGTRHINRGFHHRHVHGNSFLAGVYYLQGNKNSSGTIFFNTHKYAQIIKPARSPYGPNKFLDSWTHPFDEGTLLIFPAWLEHTTNFNRVNSEEDYRYIIGLNAMPVGKTTGDEFDRYNYQNISDADMIDRVAALPSFDPTHSSNNQTI